jgi:RNA polymerase sigma-70 factor, ECF subfamily
MARVLQEDPVSAAWRAHHAYLVDLAFRMLGDLGRAEDVVQEAFSRLIRARIDQIDDERGWLIVVTSRLCLDEIKSARARRERSDDSMDMDQGTAGTSIDPADRVTLDDNLRLALVVVLERLTPAERVTFVLHDIFQMPFDTVAATVGRTSANCRQLARRARSKIESAQAAELFDGQTSQYRQVTDAFISACSNGDLHELLKVLDPDVSGTVDIRSRLVVVGADRVARNLLWFWGRPENTLVSVSVRGQAAVLGFTDRQLTGMLLLTIGDSRVTRIHAITDPAKLELIRTQLNESGSLPGLTPVFGAGPRDL